MLNVIHPTQIKEWHVDVWVKPTYPPQYELLKLREVCIINTEIGNW